MAVISLRGLPREVASPIPVVLADVLARGRNNYDIIRLSLATAVVFGHSFTVSPNAEYVEPVLATLQFEYIGSLAVYGFFLISGLFVTESYLKSGSLRNFVTARLLRILPGLFICLLVSAYLIGPLVTAWQPSLYLANPAVPGYVVSSMALYTPGWYLPGVFEGNPVSAVNGSIWTLVGEVFCYAGVALLGVSRLLRNKEVAVCLIVFGFFYVIHKYPTFRYFSAIPGFKIPFLYFTAGMLCAVLKNHLVMSRRILALLAAATLSARYIDFDMFRLSFYALFAYAVIYLGQSSLVRKAQLSHDMSYGVYLYGFVVQQTVEYYVPLHNPLLNFALSMPVVLLLGYLSWLLVERPMIRLGSSLNQLNWGR